MSVIVTHYTDAHDHTNRSIRPLPRRRPRHTRAGVRERDWRPEFDEWDAASAHLLAFDSVDSPDRPGPSAQSASSIQSGQPDQNRPVATCRFYADPDHPDQPGRYVIARLAVLTEAQGRHIGSRLLSDAERRIAQAGGTMAAVHSENDHYKFYEQRGYRLTDEVYEGGRHGWLVKDLSRNV